MQKELLPPSNMERHLGENLKDQTTKVMIEREEEEEWMEGK